jgi:hypothetical protein
MVNRLKSKKFTFLLSCGAFAFLILISSSVYACPCGMLITREPETYDVVKEQQTFLFIDIHDERSYTIDLFFQMFTLDTSKEVMLVFPLQTIPKSVDGKFIGRKDYRDKFEIDQVLAILHKQDLGESTAKVKNDAKSIITQYLGGIWHTIFVQPLGIAGMVERIAPVARFEFEVGTLDVYSVESAATLEDLVEQLNITLPEHMEELIEKYGKMYIAVLNVQIPPPIDKSEMVQIVQNVPVTLEEFRTFLRDNPYLKIYHFYGDWEYPSGYLTYNGTRLDLDRFYSDWQTKAEIEGEIGSLFKKFAFLATIPPENVNGTEVIMDFTNNASFYYPGGALGSYKYAIPSKMYMIRTPVNLAITMKEGAVEKIITYKDWRYYIVKEDSDIFGFIRKALFGDKMEDSIRLGSEWLFDNSGSIAGLLSFLVIFASFSIAMLWAGLGKKLSFAGGAALGIIAPILSAPLTLVGFLIWKRQEKVILAGIIWLVFIILLGLLI